RFRRRSLGHRARRRVDPGGRRALRRDAGACHARAPRLRPRPGVQPLLPPQPDPPGAGPVHSEPAPRDRAYFSAGNGPSSGAVGNSAAGEDVMEKVNLGQKFSLFSEHWQPKIVGSVNDTLVKVVKFQGDFVWHHHESEDELFLVVKGRMRMGLRTGDVELGEGELFIVPKGVEHKPFAQEECWVVLIEPATTLNTGN